MNKKFIINKKSDGKENIVYLSNSESYLSDVNASYSLIDHYRYLKILKSTREVFLENKVVKFYVSTQNIKKGSLLLINIHDFTQKL